MKHLNAKGKGKIDYDYKQDILFFKTSGREYDKTVDFDDIAVDIDKEGFVTGLQIFDASKLFKVSKEGLRNIQSFELNTKAENNTISIQLFFKYLRRNQEIVQQGQSIIRESTTPLNNSELMCSVKA